MRLPAKGTGFDKDDPQYSMQKLRIEGGRRLQGVIPIAGAKNAALPALAATLLTAEEVALDRIPSVVDIRTMIGLLESIGAEIQRDLFDR